ncbi:MAG: flippase-like domain-containing protein [Candidatus Zixiibacteriota bacterium]|nr:MAG: flippase-like domain-containing protein [candidate division Zixibacteria bacterium]
MKDNVKIYIKNVVKFILFATAVYFAGRQLSNNWQKVMEYDWELNYIYLLISIILHMSTLTLFSKSWCTVLNALGFKINLRQAFKISYLANLGRYIPGKFWQLFGMIYLLRKVDIGKKTAFASWALSWIYGLPPAFLLCGMAVLLYRDLLSGLFAGIFNNDLYIVIFIFCVVLMSTLFLFIPDYSIKLLNIILRILKREKINFQFKKIMAIKIYLIYSIAWINYGLAFYFLVKGLDANSNIPFMVGLGSYVLAYVIGLLALFSPGGLGVRELVLNSLLSPYFGPVVSGIVIAARIWSLLAEFIAAAIALILRIGK